MTNAPRRTQVLRAHITKSPYFPRTEEAGAIQYYDYNHTYWPISYGRDPAEEYQAIHERAVLIDVGCERSVELRGPDALNFADYLCARNLRTMKPGRARHTAICEPNGVIFCEALVLKLSEDRVWICHGPVDFLQWANAINAHSDFDVDVFQTQVYPLAVQGLRAYEIMQELAPDAVDMKFFGWVQARVAGVETIIVRSGYTGAFGFEVFPLDPADALRVWDAVTEAGEPHGLMITPMIGPFFERGVTDWTYGHGLDLNPFEARLERAVNLDAGPFVGKEALEGVVEAGPERKLVGIRFGSEAELPPIEQFWPIEDGSGLVTRVKQSWYLGETIGSAVVTADTELDREVRVGHPGGVATGRLVALPFMD
ncbi:MAG: aminomethyl transferase family protein [Sphaerobacteraceae bacterium]|nr:MAG: aminomethyl transferase family protein [Sphaerobacteraceae bacterium]